MQNIHFELLDCTMRRVGCGLERQLSCVEPQCDPPVMPKPNRCSKAWLLFCTANGFEPGNRTPGFFLCPDTMLASMREIISYGCIGISEECRDGESRPSAMGQVLLQMRILAVTACLFVLGFGQQ